MFIVGLGGTVPYSYSWTPTSSSNSNTINVCPTISTTYTAIVTDANGCTAQSNFQAIIDNTCSDVWPGDANSDGTADNLDVLELGLHYAQTGSPRTSASNAWQSYFSNNWTGTISNGKNVNHSDCNGDGVIDNNDTLAIYNNYGLTHTFKQQENNTANPQLSIVPNQPFVNKGSWGTASVFLGDGTTQISNINGLAFTANFDQSLIEPNSFYVEYPVSFLNSANQNLKFSKPDFSNGKIYTATTHTNNVNVTGNGKIAVLHYKIKSNLATDAVLSLGITQTNQSNAVGAITPLTSGSATLMAIGASVGINEIISGNSIAVFPNPSTGMITIQSNANLQKIELTDVTGKIILSEVATATQHQLNLSNFANGVYFVKVYSIDASIHIKKVVLQQ